MLRYCRMSLMNLVVHLLPPLDVVTVMRLVMLARIVQSLVIVGISPQLCAFTNTMNRLKSQVLQLPGDGTYQSPLQAAFGRG